MYNKIIIKKKLLIKKHLNCRTDVVHHKLLSFSTILQIHLAKPFHFCSFFLFYYLNLAKQNVKVW